MVLNTSFLWTYVNFLVYLDFYLFEKTYVKFLTISISVVVVVVVVSVAFLEYSDAILLGSLFMYICI